MNRTCIVHSTDSLPRRSPTSLADEPAPRPVQVPIRHTQIPNAFAVCRFRSIPLGAVGRTFPSDACRTDESERERLNDRLPSCPCVWGETRWRSYADLHGARCAEVSCPKGSSSESALIRDFHRSGNAVENTAGPAVMFWSGLSGQILRQRAPALWHVMKH